MGMGVIEAITIERLYGFRLTSSEHRLLASPDIALSPADRQQKYLLLQGLYALNCPGCDGTLCRRSACTRWSLTEEIPSGSYRCPRCRLSLIWLIDAEGNQELAPSLPA